MEEAERLSRESQPEPVAAKPAYDAVRDAVVDISSKDSQSAILKALVQHAAEFASRGAFFIVKSDNFVGWKVFGAGGEAESTIRDIVFPVAADSVLGAAARSLATVAGPASAGDDRFLKPLEFGRPTEMVAVPLVARGRCVAVLYADGGTDGGEVTREVLETLVKVAGLTVEVNALAPQAKQDVANTADMQPPQPSYPQSGASTDTSWNSTASDPFGTYSAPATPESSPATSFETAEPAFARDNTSPSAFGEQSTGFGQQQTDFSFSEGPTFGSGSFDSAPPLPEPQPFSPPAQEYDPFAASPQYPTETTNADQPSDLVRNEPVVREFDPGREAVVSQFETGRYEPQVEAPSFATPQFGNAFQQAEDRSLQPEAVFDAHQPQPAFEPPQPAPARPAGSRLSDRAVDLPIAVPEEEKRLHNDARRFARSLASEIKLYNEKKVMDGRASADLYDRLREAIDRSREMYDKRVQPPVAAKFDYFHYELVNSLADGDVSKLGPAYPGPSI
jgi:hypothetical protein